jgi:hypothetical protein
MRLTVVLVQLVARLLGGDERGEQIGPRGGAALGDEGAEVVGEGAASGDATLAHLGVRRQQDRVEAARDVQAPALEALVVRHRNAEHLADDNDRQRVGELLDQVHPVVVLHRRQEVIDDLLDMRPEHLNHARSERLAHQAAQPGVIGRIAIQHRHPESWRNRRPESCRHEGREGLLGQTRVPQHRHHVLVPGQDPEAQRAVVNRFLAAQAVVHRVRIREELRVHRVEDDSHSLGLHHWPTAVC